MKPCKKCGETKPLSEFYRSKKCTDGYRGSCKACASLLNKTKCLPASKDGVVPLPSKDRLNELFEVLGSDLIAKISRGCVKSGSVCGYKRKDGYIRVKVDGALVMAHRIVWKMFNGDEPDFIDHINGVRSDNRIENLRSATKSINKINESLRSNSQSGFIGVSWHTPTDSRKTSKWVAKIALAGKHHHIGYFHDLKLAVLAYNAECERLHGEYGKRKIDHNLNKLREMGLL
ncbi:TPA: HNH endonuclease [Enterobacter kobei]|nr:HNH endonuclease [Enterobacter hormaechei]KAA0871272.1 HNH endonuclease [Enterobacter hormaechei]SAC88500.1 AP2 domain [Enterobacter hormaechei]HCR1070466.1 HNH endonuclease [Enterobacter kobei]